MRRTHLGLAALFGFIVLSPAGLRGQEDHALLPRYESSVLVDRADEAFGTYTIATGVDEKGELEGERVEGKVTRIVYRNPEGRSTLEIFRNYRLALDEAGIALLWTCEQNECGPAYARSRWSRYNGLFAAADGDPRYLAGTLEGPAGGTFYVAVMVGRARTQVDVVEVARMERRILTSGALARGLDRDGRVAVPGIYFDVDRSVVRPESREALEQVAGLLESRPTLRLFVVGHTDMTGGFSHNRALSEARAKAVVDALVQQFGVAADRLEGHGVGPLAPAASNATETGRQLNRRVELVARVAEPPSG